MSQMQSSPRRLTYEELCGGIETVKKLLNEDRYSMVPILVQFSDREVLLPRRRTITYLMFWQILAQLKIPITAKDYIFPMNGAFNKKVISKALTHIYRQALHYPGVTQEKLLDCLWEHVNVLARFIRIELAEFVESVNMYDLSCMHEDAPIAELRNKDLSINKGVQYIERYLSDAEKALTKILSSKDQLQHNVLYNSQRAGVLKAGQLRQLFCPIGLKTDVNDSIIMHVITPSTIQGTQNVFDYITESFIARKASFYTHDAIQTAQYFGRRQHLITMTLQSRYPGDCGTKALMPFRITQQNYRNMEGKYIVENGQYKMLNEFNLPDYIGKVINMRSPILCPHTDGTCEMCYGGLKDYIDARLNVGMISATCFVEKPSQRILGTKHYGTTDSVIYTLDPVADEFFEIVNNAISFKDHWLRSCGDIILGIPADSIRSLHDLDYISSDAAVYESKFSKVNKLKILLTDGRETDIILDLGGAIPFLSKKFLLYMKSIRSSLMTDNDWIYVPLKQMHGKPKFPIIKSVVMNYSMMSFVERIIRFTDNTISKYTNAADALTDFSTLVYSKIDDEINIVHLELLLKAYLVSGKYNYDIPVLGNVENVKFAGMQEIISNRTIGGELGFERHKKYLSSPLTYLIPKSVNPMDAIIGIG